MDTKQIVNQDPILEIVHQYQEIYNQNLKNMKDPLYNPSAPTKGYASFVPYVYDNKIDEDLMEKIGGLINYTLDKFGEVECTTADIITVRETAKVDVEYLNSIPKGAIPIAVFKRIIGIDHIPVRLTRTPIMHAAWLRFVERYKNVIPKDFG
jgi:hypothetical protein